MRDVVIPYNTMSYDTVKPPSNGCLEPPYRLLAVQLLPDVEELCARCLGGLVLGLEDIMDPVGEFLVVRIPGQKSLELGGQADEPLGVLSRARAQGRGDQLGGVAGALGEFADLVKVRIWTGRLEVASAFLQFLPGCRGKRG